jgi:hypothetical protein
MLKRLVIENYRSCLRTSLELDPSLSVLIGPNGSGKTNILHSVMLLNKLAERGDSVGRSVAKGGSSAIVASFRVGRGTAEFRMSFDPYQSENADRRHLFASQKWLLTAKNGNRFSSTIPLAFPAVIGTDWTGIESRKHYYLWEVATSRMRLLRRGKHDEEIPLWAAQIMLRVAEFCRGIKYYSASQFTNPISCPASFEIEEGRPMASFRQRGHVKLLTKCTPRNNRLRMDGSADLWTLSARTAWA